MGAGAVNGHQKQDTVSSSTSESTSKSQHSQNGTFTEQSCSTPNGSLTGLRQSSQSQTSAMKMSCETCSTNFTIFKRKKFCQECHRYFCSTCLPKPPITKASAGRQCSKCRVLISGQFSRNDLQDWKVKDMRCFLDVHKIPMIGCREKHDLIELVMTQYCTKRRNSIQENAEHDILVQRMAARMQNDDIDSIASNPDEVDSSTPTAECDQQPDPSVQPDSSDQNHDNPENDQDAGPSVQNEGSHISSEQWQELFDSMERIHDMFRRHSFSHEENVSKSTEDPKAAPTHKRRFHLEDIKEESDIEELTVMQMKELLVINFVDYKGCCEKNELIERVKRLWRDYQENKIKAERIHMADESEAAGRSTSGSLPEFKASASAETEKQSDNKSQIPLPDDPTSGGQTEHLTRPVESPPQRDELCRVCMDALSDCILLECGHMVTCTNCGKQLAECPICRQYIVRVVRVFRS